jgi:hypothetical protein
MSEINSTQPNQTNANTNDLDKQQAIEKEKQHHSELFNKWINLEYKNETSTSKIITLEKSKKIITVLKTPNDESVKDDHNFKHYVKKSKFNIAMDGDKEIFSREVENENNEVANLPVAIKENMFEILYQIHSIQRGHVGINKIENLVRQRYYGIPRTVVSKFIKLCPVCNCKAIQNVQPRLKPIRSDEIWGRIQLDLVDMQGRPCKKNGKVYKWIAHVVDHFSKFHIIWAMEHKSAEEVVSGLHRLVFPYIGLPKILQCDNGKEFKNKEVHALIKKWEGDCKMIHGRPRHPQSQGLVEQANGTMERMIASYESQFKDNDWEEFLPLIMYNLNTQQHSGI